MLMTPPADSRQSQALQRGTARRRGPSGASAHAPARPEDDAGVLGEALLRTCVVLGAREQLPAIQVTPVCSSPLPEGCAVRAGPTAAFAKLAEASQTCLVPAREVDNASVRLKRLARQGARTGCGVFGQRERVDKEIGS